MHFPVTLPDSFNLEHPAWLAAAALVGLLCALGLAWERRRRTRALQRIAEPDLLARLQSTASPGRRRAKRLLLAGAVVLTVAALARPQYGYHWEEATREGIELMFAIDTSKSMLAQDMRPDRLTRAKLAVSDLVEKFQGDRVGLVAFSGDAFLQVPMTLDRDVFEQTLRQLEPGIVPIGGTDLASAIRTADRAFEESGNGQRILVLLSDGEDLEGQALAAAETAADHGVTIYTVGVGGTEGELISVPDGKGGSTIVRDEQGQPVSSRLDEDTLTQLATLTGGAYVPLGSDGLGLERLYDSKLSSLEKHTVESRSHRVYHDRFEWLLIPALLFALIEPFVSARGRKRSLGRKVARAATPAALVLVLLTASASPARAAEADPEQTYNSGVEAYDGGDWDTAIEAFDAAIAGSEVQLQQKAWYNRGNAQYRAGQAALEQDRDKTRSLWQDAVEAYDTAIELDGDDEDAVFNRDFVARKLEELQEEEPPPQDQDQQQQDDQEQQDDQQSGGDQGQQDQSQDGDDSEQGDASADSQGEEGEQKPDETSADEASADEGSADEASADEASADEASADETSADEAGSPEEQGTDEQQAAQAGDQQDQAADPKDNKGLAAAAPSEDGSLSPEQAAALVRAVGGDDATVPLFAPGTPSPSDEPPRKDW